MAKGIDYAWQHPDPAAIRKAGYTFCCRYLSHDISKNINRAEAKALRAAGLAVVFVWESTANRALGGAAAGVEDARAAIAQFIAAGAPNTVPIYFAVDFDATEVQQAALNAYFRAVEKELGLARTGVYGGYWVVKRLFDAGLVTFGWQTYAWSGGKWDPRVQLRQVENGIKVAGVGCDRDVSVAPNFGQWNASAPPSPKPLVAPAVLRRRTGFYSWLAWYLGRGDWKPYGRRNAAVRPRVGKKIKRAWWLRLVAFLAKGKR